MKNEDIENKIDTLKLLGYKYYVYEHHIGNKVFYVGKGSNYRALDLLSRSFYWESFVKGNTDNVEIVIKGFFESELDALKLEMITIGEYVNDGINLANVQGNRNINVVYEAARDEIDEKRRLKADKIFSIIKNNVRFIPRDYSLNPILLSSNFLDTPLPIYEKSKLVNQLSIKNMKGETIRWRKLKKVLEESGYEIIERTLAINGIRCRTSTLKVKAESLANMLENKNINVVYEDASVELDGKRRLKADNKFSMTKKDAKFVPRDYSLNPILLSSNFLDTPLPIYEKSKLVNQLSIKNMKGETIRWRQLKKVLEESGYEIIDKTLVIDGKRQRTSTITRP